MRRCKISPHSCRHRRTTPCCKDCQEPDCENRCRNDPARCGCWEDKPPRQKRERKFDPLLVAWLRGQGLSQAQIAQWLGCNRKTVARILHEMEASRHDES